MMRKYVASTRLVPSKTSEIVSFAFFVLTARTQELIVYTQIYKLIGMIIMM